MFFYNLNIYIIYKMIVNDISKINLIDKFGNLISKRTIREDLININEINKSYKFKKLVFLLIENNYESILFYISLLKSQNTIALINANIKTENLYELVKSYNPNTIVTKKNIEFKNYNQTLTFKNYYCYENKKKTNLNINDELFFLLTTSGSTGSSKYVRISYKNVEANTKSIVKFLKINNTDRLITTLPPDYTYGFSLLNTHLFKGSSIILNDYSIIQREFWDLLTKTKATTFGGVPYTFDLLKKIRFENYKISSLKYITQAGGKLSSESHKYFFDILKKKKIKFIIMYGATEATSRMSYLPWSDSGKKIGSIGIPIPGSSMEISKPDQKKIGEIVFKGQNVSLGYANSYKDLIKGDINRGKLKTGDIGYKDSQGFFYIVARKKRFLKLLGYRINLDELELKLRKLTNYKMIYCTGNDNELVIHLDNDKIKNNLLLCLIKEFKINKNLVKFKIFKDLSLTNSGKINYKKLDENSK